MVQAFPECSCLGELMAERIEVLILKLNYREKKSYHDEKTWL